MSSEPDLDADAAIVLGFASTAMPFARTPEDEAERWLRILRVHGDVGHLLQALGVSDASLDDGAAEPRADGGRPDGDAASERDRDPVALVAAEAAAVAERRGSVAVATTDVLTAVMHVYGEDFDRVLRAHGTDRAAVLKLLGASRATT